MKTKRLITSVLGLVATFAHVSLWSTVFGLRIDPSVRVDPAQIAFTSIGQKDTVEVWVDNVTNLGAFEFNVVYDPAVVQAQSVELGEFLGSTGRMTFSPPGSIDNAQGRLIFGAVTFGGPSQAGPTGSGILARIIFIAQTPGTSVMRLEKVKLVDVRDNVMANVRLDPAQIFAKRVGEKFTVAMWVDNASNLQFFNFDLGYDTTIVRAQGVTLGGFLASTGRTATPNGPVIDHNRGRISFGATTSGTQNGPAGSGILATIMFESRAPGITSLKFETLIVRIAEDMRYAGQAPKEFKLWQNYPNPFHLTTRLVYHHPQSGKLRLRISNILGQTIRVLADETRPAGIYESLWDGRNNQGAKVTGGIYWAHFEAGSFAQTRKIIYVP